MHMRNLFLVLMFTFSGVVFSGDRLDPKLAAEADFVSRLNGRTTFADVAMELVKELQKKGYITLGFGLLGLFAVSLMQKENPDFFNAMVRKIWDGPYSIINRNLEKFFCHGGQSLTWNEVASWHNRVSRLLTPLTKTTSMVDLSKDRRLRIMDQEDGQDEGHDDQWKKQSMHIQRECDFLVKMLTMRLSYYKDQPQAQSRKTESEILRVAKMPLTASQALGKAIMRTSLTRNEEIAFGLHEAISYLKETAEYCKSVSHFSGIDKEHMKRLMGSICTTFEHIGVLVDEISAADKNKKKLPMTADGTLSRGGYTGGSYGGYDSSYGAGGSYG